MLFLTLIYLALYFEKSISIELLRTFNFVTFSLGLTSTTLILPRYHNMQIILLQTLTLYISNSTFCL